MRRAHSSWSTVEFDPLLTRPLSAQQIWDADTTSLPQSPRLPFSLWLVPFLDMDNERKSSGSLGIGVLLFLQSYLGR